MYYVCVISRSVCTKIVKKYLVMSEKSRTFALDFNKK